jgi:hypothetical protein
MPSTEGVVIPVTGQMLAVAPIEEITQPDIVPVNGVPAPPTSVLLSQETFTLVLLEVIPPVEKVTNSLSSALRLTDVPALVVAEIEKFMA